MYTCIRKICILILPIELSFERGKRNGPKNKKRKTISLEVYNRRIVIKYIILSIFT